MDLFEAYKTDKTVETEGVWVPFPHVNVKIRLARAGGSNKQWEIERERALRPLRRRYKDQAIPESELFEALLEPFSKLILQDWEGVMKGDKKVECTHKNKVALCRELPDFYHEMLGEAGQLENFRTVEDQEDAGKSQSGSSGTKDTETPSE